MLYLLGGTARTWKTTIARRFLAETGIPHFSLDILMMGFTNGLPEYGVDSEDDELRIAELLWPVVKAMCVALLEDNIDYMFEGAQLHPSHVRELSDMFPGQVHACFVGFAEMDTMTKFAHIRDYGGDVEDWMRGYADQQVIAEVDRLKELSRRVRDACDQSGIEYFEASPDMHETVERVLQYLLD